MPAIETQNLTKRFGELTAVRELRLTVEEGELFIRVIKQYAKTFQEEARR